MPSAAPAPERTAILLLSCPDRKGLMAAVADFIYAHNANIVHFDQHHDVETNLLIMRVEWDLSAFDLELADFRQRFWTIAKDFGMSWRVATSEDRQRVAIFVSKGLHCLADLLYRHSIGELRCEIPFVLSNHQDAQGLADFYKIPFFHVEVGQDKKAAEDRQLDLLRQHTIDLVVLARYMQILSNEFISRFPHRIINIHHSFLPAFIGAKPYHRSFERGVKLVGATSHYVTEVLDEGPIIEQDVARISHRDTLDGLIQKGSDLEKVVLSRAVRWHLENKVIVFGNKTVVF